MLRYVVSAVCMGIAWAGSVRAQEAEQKDAGASIFRAYCSSCHGKSGKGDGSLAESLRYRPSDLTLIAQRNKGTFPTDDVFKMIDGRKAVKGHGDTDMPVWGDAFKSSRQGFSEDSVKRRIDALVEHLESIQAKKEAK